MLERERLLKSIAFALSLLRTNVELQGFLRLFDINIITEDLFAGVLNSVYDLNLGNLNHLRTNFPGVDLGDKKAKTCFQVTSETTKAKVQEALDTFARHHLESDFSHVRVLIIGRKASAYKNLRLPKGVTLNPDDDIIDIKGLVTAIEHKDTKALQAIEGIILHEMPSLSGRDVAVQHSDREALEIYRDDFDRSALHDDWRGERSFARFDLLPKT